MHRKKTRTLIAIGGDEIKSVAGSILEEIARRMGTGRMVVATVAARQPDSLFERRRRELRESGIKQIAHLKIESRQHASDENVARLLDNAKGVFFTSGDQLKITSQLADTPVYKRISEIYKEGGVIAGTSSASVMCETMIVSASDEELRKAGSALHMAPGLSLIAGVIIDQHFSERGRIRHLLGAIAQNPRNIGIGIDENTAIIVENESGFRVAGGGIVCVIDCSETTESNIGEAAPERSMSIHDVKLHLLGHGERFDLHTRRPFPAGREKAEPVSAKT